MQTSFTLFLYCLGIKIKSNLKTLYFAKEIHTAYIFLGCTTQMSQLFKGSSILDLPGKIALKNGLSANKYFNKLLNTICRNCFT